MDTPLTTDTLIDTDKGEPPRPQFHGDVFAIAEQLKHWRFTIGRRERDLGDAIETILKDKIGVQYIREYSPTGTRARIDFYLPGPNIGIELKVVGGPSIILRQLMRYAQAPDISEILLVTMKGSSVARIPQTLSGKTVHVLNLGKGGLL